MPLSKPMLTVEEVAELTKLTPRTVRSMIHQGDLQAVKFGKEYRIPVSFLNDYLEAHLTTPGPRQPDKGESTHVPPSAKKPESILQ